MRTFLVLPIFLVIFASCTNNEPAKEKTAGFTVDSAFAAQQLAMKNDNAATTDTAKLVALPHVSEGDIIFQNVTDDKAKLFATATGSKYNNVGLIFLRPRDNLYMVVEAGDSVHAVPLTDWVNKGIGKHVVICRIKNAEMYLNEKKTAKLKKSVKDYSHIPYDPFLSWSDDQMYPSELIYKIYHNSLGVLLCDTRKFSSLNFMDAGVKKKFYEKYQGNFPLESEVVTPDDILHSKNVDLVFER